MILIFMLIILKISIYHFNIILFLMMSESILILFFILFSMNFHMNFLLFFSCLVSIMIIESCLGILLIFDFLCSNKVFLFMNNMLF